MGRNYTCAGRGYRGRLRMRCTRVGGVGHRDIGSGQSRSKGMRVPVCGVVGRGLGSVRFVRWGPLLSRRGIGHILVRSIRSTLLVHGPSFHIHFRGLFRDSECISLGRCLRRVRLPGNSRRALGGMRSMLCRFHSLYRGRGLLAPRILRSRVVLDLPCPVLLAPFPHRSTCIRRAIVGSGCSVHGCHTAWWRIPGRHICRVAETSIGRSSSARTCSGPLRPCRWPVWPCRLRHRRRSGGEWTPACRRCSMQRPGA